VEYSIQSFDPKITREECASVFMDRKAASLHFQLCFPSTLMTTSCSLSYLSLLKIWLLFGLIFLINYGDIWFQIGVDFSYLFIYIYYLFQVGRQRHIALTHCSRGCVGSLAPPKGGLKTSPILMFLSNPLVIGAHTVR
jgi:hypothetical protein